jgi:hypothetical protein
VLLSSPQTPAPMKAIMAHIARAWMKETMFADAVEILRMFAERVRRKVVCCVDVESRRCFKKSFLSELAEIEEAGDSEYRTR